MPTENNEKPKSLKPVTELDNSSEPAASTKRRKAHVSMGPLPGHTWNPLLRLPRNMPCPCRSQKKFKVCCLSKLPQAVKIEDAKTYEEQIAKGELVFVTKENELEMRVAADMQGYFKELDRRKREENQGVN